MPTETQKELLEKHAKYRRESKPDPEPNIVGRFEPDRTVDSESEDFAKSLRHPPPGKPPTTATNTEAPPPSETYDPRIPWWATPKYLKALLPVLLALMGGAGFTAAKLTPTAQEKPEPAVVAANDARVKALEERVNAQARDLSALHYCLDRKDEFFLGVLPKLGVKTLPPPGTEYLEPVTFDPAPNGVKGEALPIQPKAFFVPCR